jgi:hypothetical protein
MILRRAQGHIGERRAPINPRRRRRAAAPVNSRFTLVAQHRSETGHLSRKASFFA